MTSLDLLAYVWAYFHKEGQTCYIKWQVELCSSHNGQTYSSFSHVSPHEVIICRKLVKTTLRVKENSLCTNYSGILLVLRLPLY